jgi:phosphatidylglycerophosphate synthase
LLVAGTYSAVLAIGVARARRDDGTVALGPADLVTLTRAVLVAGVAAMAVDSLYGPVSVPVLVGLAVVALALDAVDGFVARRTESASSFGARFDMEIDAFLIAVLSAAVAKDYGAWVLAIGVARYSFWIAGRLWPWIDRPLPYRYWRKVAAATQGVVLAVVVSGLLPRSVNLALLVGAMALLAESFGRDLVWLWRHRATGPADTSVAEAATPDAEAGAPSAEPERPVAAPRPRGRARRVLGATSTVLAFCLVWVALTAPDAPGQGASALLRIPVEGLVLVAIALMVPPRASRVIAVGAGVVLAVLTLLKVLDLGFGVALDRPFDPVTDWAYFGPAFGVLGDSVGHAAAVAVVVAAALLVTALLALLPLSTRRVAIVAGRHGVGTARTVAALGVVWIGSALLGLQIAPGAAVASASTGGLAYNQVRAINGDVADEQAFTNSISHDPQAITPGNDLLTALRGKDVLFVFVESFGKVALTDPLIAPGVDAVLMSGTKELAAAGFSARSGYLTSSTFGGISWLAHSTLQSGLWIDNQLRYNELVTSNRFTLSDAFARAGWRTVGDVPSNYTEWPEGMSFYHYDQIYDAHNAGYVGPQFSYSQMPDQYILSAFQRMELAKPHSPVMAEIDLVSSHTPWAPLPTMVNWDAVGNGAVFDGMPASGASPTAVWSTADGIRRAYGQSIQYSMTALSSFVATYPDPNLVMVVLGDHQPASVVSGSNPSHDVPISVIAHDPTVLDRIDGWGWTDGLRPADDAPVWRMDSFRNKFLAAFGS